MTLRVNRILLFLLLLTVLLTCMVFADPTVPDPEATLTNIEITGVPNTLATGDNIQIILVGTYSDNSTRAVDSGIVWTSSAENIAIVDPDNLEILVDGFGEVTLTASVGDLTDSVTVTVRGPLTGIKINEPLITTGPFQLTLTGTFSDGSTAVVTEGFTWSSNNISVATVNTDGLVTLEGVVGSFTITVTNGVLTDTVLIAVITPPVALVGIEIFIVDSTETTAQLDVIGYYNDYSADFVEGVTWSSSNEEIIIVDENGLVELKGGTGYAEITATKDGFIATFPVYIEEPYLIYISINETLPTTGFQQLTVTGTYSDSNEYTLTTGIVWDSSNTDVATVDDNGLVTLEGGYGNVTITATIASEYDDIIDAVSVTVTAPAPEITLTNIDINETLPATGTRQLTITATYSDSTIGIVNTGIVWTSSNNALATVSANGIVTIVGYGGTVTITATKYGKSDSISVFLPVLEAVKSIEISGTIPSDGSRTLKVTATYFNGSTEVVTEEAEWYSSNSRIASVNSRGRVTIGSRNGRVTITATYEGKTDSITKYIDNDYDDDLTSFDTYVPLVTIPVATVPVVMTQAQIEQREEANKTSGIESALSTMYSTVISTKDLKNKILKIEEVERSLKTNSIEYKDIKGHWSERELIIATKLGIVNGFDDNTIKPNKTLTREEFAALIVKAFNIKVDPVAKANVILKDVPATSWSAQYIQTLANLGIINGYPDKTFKPMQEITKAEMAAILSKLINKGMFTGSIIQTPIADINNNWAKDSISQLAYLGVLDGVTKEIQSNDILFNKKYEPNKTALRADAINIIVKMLEACMY